MFLWLYFSSIVPSSPFFSSCSPSPSPPPTPRFYLTLFNLVLLSPSFIIIVFLLIAPTSFHYFPLSLYIYIFFSFFHYLLFFSSYCDFPFPFFLLFFLHFQPILQLFTFPLSFITILFLQSSPSFHPSPPTFHSVLQYSAFSSHTPLFLLSSLIYSSCLSSPPYFMYSLPQLFFLPVPPPLSLLVLFLSPLSPLLFPFSYQPLVTNALHIFNIAFLSFPSFPSFISSSLLSVSPILPKLILSLTAFPPSPSPPLSSTTLRSD